MMIKEINEIFEEDTNPTEKSWEVGKTPPKENIYPVEQRYRHRYTEVDLNGEQFLVPKSCKSCYSTGIYCWIPEDKVKGTPKIAVRCKCLIKPEETKLNAKKA